MQCLHCICVLGLPSSPRWNEDRNSFEYHDRLLPCVRSNDDANPTEISISKEIARVQRLAGRKAAVLKGAADVGVGIELLHLFIGDVLGKDTYMGRIWFSAVDAE